MKFEYEHSLNNVSKLKFTAVTYDHETANDQYIIDDDKGLDKKYDFKVIGSYNNEIGHFSFSPMPGCCGIVVSHDTYLNPDVRRTFNSNAFRGLKEAFAKRLGYSRMIATTVMSDPASSGNMMKSGYRINDVFRNKRTSNDVGIGIKKI